MSEAGKSGSEAGKTGASPTPPPSPAAPAADAQISIADFQRLALRVGVITAAEDHPNADRLLVLTVDIGEAAPRRVVAGIRGSYQAADLVGKRVVVVANLKPAQLRGIESQGMVLVASEGGTMALLNPDKPVAPGSTVK